MACTRYGLGALIALLVVISVTWAAPVRAEGAWRIVELSGTAQVVQPGVTPIALTSGDTLAPGQRVSTGPTGRVVLERGASVITVSPNSRMGLPETRERGLATRIIHSIGTVLFKVEKRAEQHFEVQTPFMAAVVKGTRFTTSVDARGGAVHVVSGLVEVNDPRSGQTAMVRPGQTAIRAARGTGLQIVGQNAPRRASAPTTSDDEAVTESEDSQGGTDRGTTQSAEAPGRSSESPGGDDGGNGKGLGADLPANAQNKGNGTTISVGLGATQINPSEVTNGLVRGRSQEARGRSASAPGRSNNAPGLSQDTGPSPTVGSVDQGNNAVAGPAGVRGGGPPSATPGGGVPGGGPPSATPGGGVPGGGANSGAGKSNGNGPPSGNPGRGNGSASSKGNPGNSNGKGRGR